MLLKEAKKTLQVGRCVYHGLAVSVKRKGCWPWWYICCRSLAGLREQKIGHKSLLCTVKDLGTHQSSCKTLKGSLRVLFKESSLERRKGGRENITMIWEKLLRSETGSKSKYFIGLSWINWPPGVGMWDEVKSENKASSIWPKELGGVTYRT